MVLPTDVADASAVEAAAEAVESRFGPIDVWVNNAMTSVFSPVKEMEPEEYKRVTEVTYLGFVYGSLAALKRMLPRDHGVIVQVGSALAYRRHTAAIGLLRGQACHPGLLRFASLRAPPRSEQGARGHGTNAGHEHATIQLGEKPTA